MDDCRRGSLYLSGGRIPVFPTEAVERGFDSREPSKVDGTEGAGFKSPAATWSSHESMYREVFPRSMMSAACPTLGVLLRMRLHPSRADADGDLLVDDLVAHVEAHDLVAMGSGRRDCEYSIYRHGSQLTHDDREALVAWAGRWAEVATITVSDLFDLESAA